MSTNRIPVTDSIQELARFWDTHDLTDFEDQLDGVAEPVFERETVVQIPLPSEEAQAAAQIAASKGVSLADLIRQWVTEKVHAS